MVDVVVVFMVSGKSVVVIGKLVVAMDIMIDMVVVVVVVLVLVVFVIAIMVVVVSFGNYWVASHVA